MNGARILTPVAEFTLYPKDFHDASAAAGTFTTANEAQIYDTLDFDQTTSEYAALSLVLPKCARFGATVYWTAASGTGGVAWVLGQGTTNIGATLDMPGGFASVGSSTLTGVELLQTTELPITELTSAAPGALLSGVLYRTPASAGDTLNADARLLALVVRVYG